MRAVCFTAVHRLEIIEVPDPLPAVGEVVVRLRAAALNHRDAWIKSGDYAGVRYPCIPGSDGAGVVESAGPGADRSWLGREVIINPAVDWGVDPRAQSSAFTILGLPHPGTLAERVAVPVSQLAPKPAHLDFAAAAALPLAGLTAWRALMTRGGFRPSDRVLISGIGGGVAIFALQFAAARQGDVWVTSGSAEKIGRAIELGARAGFLYNQAGWAEEAAARAGQFDLVIDSAGGADFNHLIDLTAPGGRVVFFGATRGNPPTLALRKVFWRQLSLLGTTMGDPLDWQRMTAFVGDHKIRPVVAGTFALDQAAKAFELLEHGGRFGKIVIQI
jgi:NADPH:quinone reductase-like Zn-dependent oxidoreductase